MNRLKVLLFAIALTLVTPTPTQALGDGYSYAFMLDAETARTYTMESVPPVTLGNNIVNPGNCFFTPKINLSGLKNPVLRRWEFVTTSSMPSPGKVAYTILSYGDKNIKYIGVSNPTVDEMIALPAIDGLRWGRNIYLEDGPIFTVGEMPANKDDITIEDFTTQIVKGESMGDDGVMPDETYNEAEIRFSATGLTNLDQAYARINVNEMIDIDYEKNLVHGGEMGVFNCFAITPDGEIELCYIGTDWTDHCFLLPAKTQEIVLRLRFRRDSFNITQGNSQKFLSAVVQPGYHTQPAPAPDIQLSDSSTAIPLCYTISIYNYNMMVALDGVNTAYDMDGNGILEWTSEDRESFDGNRRNALATFNKDFTQLSFANSNFGKALGFTANSGNTLGYDASSIFSVDENCNRTELYSTTKPRFAFVDFDNDGKTDFINLADNTVITLAPDGTTAVQELRTMTMDEYLGILPPGDNPLGSGLSIVGDTKAPPAVFASYVQTDINGDGYPDFVDATSGNYYMNLGDGRFVTASFGGKLLFRDFDGDGINDILLYDKETRTVSVTLQRIGEDAVTKKLISGYYCDDDIWIRDFDKDGDLDILVPFSAKNNNGMAFLVMFENDGRGSFKKKEYVFDEAVNFRKCIDWDSDGNYEVLTDMYKDSKIYSKEVGLIPSFKVNGLTVNTTPEYIVSDLVNVPYAYNRTNWEVKDVLDFDNSGHLRFWFNEFILTTPATPNARPQKPASPQLNFDANTCELTITWSRGNDKETSAADITYELRIGSTPGGDDIMSAAATPDGKRRNALRGNCGYELKRKLNTSTWPAGDIYISIQAIDDSGLGSEFSDAAVFKNTQLPAQFTIEAPVNVAVYEEIVLKATSDITGLTIEWSAEGGELLSASGSEARMRFTTPGVKTIAMKVSDGAGNSRTKTAEVDIYPIRFARDSGMPEVDWAADLDLDGVAEVHDDYYYEGDKSGKYTKLKSLFNTRIDAYPATVDINRDGLPDIISTSRWLINAGDKSMDDATPEIIREYMFLPDLNNDGLGDVSYNGKLMKNLGGYDDFTEYDSYNMFGENYIDSNTIFYDFNRDGLMDVFFLTGVNFWGTYSISNPMYYENLGNFNFRAHELPTEIDGIKVGYRAVDDFDGNGKADFLCNGDNGFFILWDNNERTSLGDLSKMEIWNFRYDFDNNGCNDLFIYDGIVFLFNPDHTFTTVDAESSQLRDKKPYLRSDGKAGIRNSIIHGAPNEKPSAPTGVKAVVEDNKLMITWDMATDKETPSAALRYNLSVKRANADGEDAYIVSPLNGGLNGVPLPSDANIIDATCYPIPLMALPTDEYEIKVQAVDSRMCPGDFSTPITVKVESLGYEAPTETMVGETVVITFNADVNVAKVDFGTDAVVERISGQSAYVYWTSDGVKTVTAGNLQFTIVVHPELDASFSLPMEIAGGAKVYLPADAAFEHTWKMERYHQSFRIWEPFGVNPEVIDDKTVAIQFSFYASYTKVRLTHTVTAPYGSATYSVDYAVVKNNYLPAIGIVDIDDATGKYCVRTMDLDTDVTDYMVYKETEATGQYELLGYVGGNSTFVDMESSPIEHSSRYLIKARLYYGESLQGKPHQPIHAMISKGINNEWNISWNKYEGREASTYRILRGNSPSSLECIAEVSGNITSYSDYNAPQATQFYVVETLIAKPSAAQAPALISRAGSEGNYWRSRSNTVSTNESGVNDVTVDDDKPFDIFNLQGICIKRNATAADIDNLVPGLYIINGMKVYVNKH